MFIASFSPGSFFEFWSLSLTNFSHARMWILPFACLLNRLESSERECIKLNSLTGKYLSVNMETPSDAYAVDIVRMSPGLFCRLLQAYK